MLTNDDFIRMAKEAGFDVDNDNIVWCDFGTYDDELIKFAALVATHIEEQIGIKMLFDMVQAVEDEREACAKLCEQPITEIQITDDCSETIYKDYKDCAEAIRARGKND
jgi:hypothetical protein